MIPGALLLLLGCGGARDATDGAPAVERDLVAIEDFRINSDETNPASLFTSITQVLRLGDGRVGVLQALSPLIMIFDSTGKYLRSVGGKGSGPGEFPSSIARMGLEGDTLWAHDTVRETITRWDRDFTFAGTRKLFPGQRDSLRLLGVLSANMYVAHTESAWFRKTDDVRYYLASPHGNPATFLLQTFPDSTTIEFRPDMGDVNMSRTFNPRSNSEVAPGSHGDIISLYATNHYSYQPHISVSPSGGYMVIAINRESEPPGSPPALVVRWIRRDGSTTERRFDGNAEPIPSAEPDSLARELAQSYANFARARPKGAAIVHVDIADLAARIRRRYGAPVFRPPARGVMAGSDGTAWVYSGGGKWRLFDSTGAQLGRLQAPKLTVHSVARDHAWMSGRDSLDVPFLVRYRIK
jgi:hypothetical protein